MFLFERYYVDNDGYVVEKVVSDEVNIDLIDVKIPSGLHKPRWNDTEWVEGLSEDKIQEIREINLLNQNKLSEIELLKLSQAEQFEHVLELLEGMM